jgi:DNA-binding GntR family transcriptional regulator
VKYIFALSSTQAGFGLSSDLHHELIGRISEHVRLSAASDDLLLRESTLARMLGVSRTPIRTALQHLVSDGILQARESGGYTVVRIPSADAPTPPSTALADGPYSRMLRDIILNAIPAPISESKLMRRYGTGRGEILKALRRLVREGLVEPLAGRGWSFIPFGRDQMQRSYHLRLVLEPAILLDAGYRADRDALLAIRADHEAALPLLKRERAGYDMFELDAGFHELLARGSGNELIVDIIRRQNRVRRLAEYVSYSRVKRIRQSMMEHVSIIDAVLERKLEVAARLLRSHLTVSRDETLRYVDADLQRVKRQRSVGPF